MELQIAKERWNAELTAAYDSRERQQMWRHLRRSGRPSSSEDLGHIISRLLKHEPFDYIIGTSEFFGLELRVGPGVLIPRPETEELIDWILRSVSENPSRSVLDIGTGSGCIAVSLAVHRPSWKISAVDVSPAALTIARDNAQRYEAPIEFHQMNILETAPSEEYDLIVSNPPYIPDGEQARMSPGTLKYEPAGALFTGSDDPLLFYRRIGALGGEMLSIGGALYFELNEFHADAAAAMLRELDYVTEIREDLQGKPRMLKARR